MWNEYLGTEPNFVFFFQKSLNILFSQTRNEQTNKYNWNR